MRDFKNEYGIILGLGLITIAICFYIILNIPYWLMLWKIKNNGYTTLKNKYHRWVYSSDDAFNKILKYCVYFLYGYGFYIYSRDLV